MEGFYEVTVSPYVFYVKVEREDDMYILRLGSSEFSDCGSVQVYENDSVAELHGLMYNELCSTNTRMSREDRGSQKMVHALIKVTRQLFPFVAQFQLTDASVIDCNFIPKSVYLQDMYFYRYGCTWYEKYFGAKIELPTYDELKRAFLQKPAHLDFDATVWKYMPPDTFDRQKVYDIFVRSNTWHEFFQKWWEVDGCTPFMYIHSERRSIMNQIFSKVKTLYGTKWIIDMDVATPDYEIQVKKVGRVPKIAWENQSTTTKVRRIFGGEMYIADWDAAD